MSNLIYLKLLIIFYRLELGIGDRDVRAITASFHHFQPKGGKLSITGKEAPTRKTEGSIRSFWEILNRRFWEKNNRP